MVCAQLDGGAPSSSLIDRAAGDGGASALLGRPRDLPFEVDLRARGKLTKEEIHAALRLRRPAVQRCYEQALQRDRPDTSGSLTVSFTIGAAGTVTSAEVSQASPTFSAGFKRCVVDAIKALTTARPRGGGEVKVNSPFIFEPG